MPATKLHLRTIELRDVTSGTGFPFRFPAVRTLPRVDLTSPVTFLVGANGSGKSTLLEANAVAAGLPAGGSEEVNRDTRSPCSLRDSCPAACSCSTSRRPRSRRRASSVCSRCSPRPLAKAGSCVRSPDSNDD